MAASLLPVVEQPGASSGSGACHRRLIMSTQRISISAGLRVLVLVDHVLVERLGHQALGLRLHPRSDERGEVEARVAIEHEFVVDDLVGDFRDPSRRRAGDGAGRARLRRRRRRSSCALGGASSA